MLIYTTIYLFHMPVFVFMSGYLASPKKGPLDAFREVFLLYLVAQVSWTVFESVVAPGRWKPPTIAALLGISPGWGLWYLLALYYWRLLVPVLVAVHRPLLMLGGLIVLAVVAGKTNLTTTLSLSRAVGFLPFFAAGVWARKHSWLLVDSRWHRRDVVWLAGATLLAPILVTFLAGNSGLLVHLSTPYGVQGVSPKDGALFRIGLFVVAFAAVRASFLLAPRRKTFLTAVGVNSLSVYLVHFYLLEPLRNRLSLESWQHHVAWIATAVTVLMCAIAPLRLARPWEWMRASLDAQLFGRQGPESTAMDGGQGVGGSPERQPAQKRTG